jgi:invasion protein IalB
MSSEVGHKCTGAATAALYAFIALALTGAPLPATADSVKLLSPLKESATLPEPEVTPRGRQQVRDITFDDWRKLCFKAPGAQALCRTTITGRWDTGQIAIRVDLVEREGSPRLQILLPVGLYLQAGVKVTLDGGTSPLTLPYSWCFANLCVAATVAGDEIIQALGASRTAAIEVVDSNLNVLTTTIPLESFGRVQAGAPAQTFEQVIDE